MLELITDWDPITRGLVAFIAAFAGTLAIGNKVILKLISMKLGQPVRTKEEVNELFDLHGSKAGTPTMGGVMILATMVLAVLLAGELTNTYLHVCLFVMLGLGALGFKDDYAKISQGNSKGVSSKFKLVWQFGVALGAALWLRYFSSGGLKVTEVFSETKGDAETQLTTYLMQDQSGWLFIPGFEWFLPIGFLGLILGVIVIVGSSNAVNLTDGLDGLASGCTITTALAYVAISLGVGYEVFSLPDALAAEGAALDGESIKELVVFLAAMIGSVAGFLWFNAYPARVFMGDTGSLALGGALGAVALCVKQEILLAIIGFVFVVEALSVMAQVGYFKFTKKTKGEGKRLLKCAPVHHHFELSGWKENQVITRFWIVSAICAGIGLYLFFK